MSCSSAAASIAFERRLVVDAERAREAERVRLHAAHVAVRHVVFGVDRHRQRFDRRQVQAIESREVPARVFEPAERRPQREVKHHQQRQDHATAARLTCCIEQHRDRTPPTPPPR